MGFEVDLRDFGRSLRDLEALQDFGGPERSLEDARWDLGGLDGYGGNLRDVG